MGEVKGTKLLRKGYIYIYIYIISVFGPRPYSDAIANLRVADHYNPIKLLIPGRTPAFQPIFYCRFYNQYAISHEHDCGFPRGPFDGYPSDAPSTD